MSSSTAPRVFTTLPEGLEMPFHYASLSSLWLWFSADVERVAPLVRHAPGVQLQAFGGRALVAFNFQRYTSHHDTFLKTTTEVEINTVVAPAGPAEPAPSMDLDTWVHGGDATRRLGQLRLHVPADNPFAVWAGQQLFGEPKFVADFRYRVPSLNARDARDYTMTVVERPGEDTPRDATPKVLCEARARLDGLAWRAAALSPVHKLAVLDGRTVATAWNLLGLSEAALIPASERDRVTLTAGDASHAMRDDLASLHASLVPVAVQRFESAPVAVETRGWFVSAAEGVSR
ncbi:MAG: hypothetical protein U0325_03370 [Polyangiales bacterium]